MKLKTLILTMVLLSSGISFAQEYYFRLNAGYGTGISSQTDYDYYSTETAPNTSSFSFQTKDYSFGQGAYFGAAIGHFLNQNIGFELELQYLKGASYPLHKEYDLINTGKFVYDYENYANAFMINPSVLLRTQLNSFKPYLKLGAVFSFGTIHSNVSGYNTNNNARTNFSSEMQYSGGTMIGLNAAVGTSYEVGSNIDLFFEMNSKNMSYSPTEGEMKKYELNGTDYLSRLTTSLKEIKFVEDGKSTASQNPNLPTQQRKESFPFSSLSFMIGVGFRF